MFLGEYEHSLDAKGRVILPAKFRARLAGGCVLTKAQDHCLAIYPKEEWDRLAERLREARLSSQRLRDFARLFFSGASEEEPDRQGRVSIPESLRRYASLEREVTLIGAGTRIEIWERASWERYRQQAEPQYADMIESPPDLPV